MRESSRSFATGLATASASLVVAIAGLGLLGWLIDAPLLTAWRDGALPMAPITTVLALALGVALLLRRPAARLTLGAVVALVAGALLVSRLRGLYPAIETLWFAVDGYVGSARVGFISPVTAASFCAAAIALMGLASGDRWRPAPVVAGVMGGVLGSVGFGFMLVNLFGVPLLAHETFIPPALNTAVLIAALGAALALCGAPRRRSEAQTLQDGRAVFVAIGLAVVASVVAGSYAFYRQEEGEIRRQAELELQAISRLQSELVFQWRRERLADGEVLRRNTALGALVGRYLNDPSATEARVALSQWIQGYEAYRDYDAAWLFDPAGSVRLTALAAVGPPSAAVVDSVGHVAAAAAVDLVDFYVESADGTARLALLVPIGETGAVLALRIDPRPFLLPLVEGWPNASVTGESVLVRRDGVDVLTLTTPRFAAAGAMSHRTPADEDRWLAAQALRGTTEVIEGLDYHGAPAVGVTRPIRSSSWQLITLVDLSELDGALWHRVWQVVTVAALLIAVLGVGIAFVWQRQRIGLVAARKVEETRAGRLAQLYAGLSACNDAIVRCASEAELCDRICEVAVSQGGLAMAWVGLVDQTTGAVRVVAAHGNGKEYVEGLAITVVPDEPASQGPTGRAIRERCPVWSADAGREVAAAPWRERSLAFGWVESGAIPLFRGGRAIGALSVYSTSRDTFDADSRRLLTEMGANISFAFDAFDRDARRRDAEARLAESAEYYAKLFAEGRLARLLVDPITGHIVEANPAAVALYGWDAEVLTGMRVSDLNTASPEAILEAMARARVGEQTRFEFRHRTANGALIDVEVWSSSVTVRGRSLLLSTILDVTEQKQLQRQFLQSQKMEVVGRLAGGIAHDFNNLLTVINGTADVAMAELPADSQLRKDLESILQAGARAAQLTKQLLAFSRREQPEPVAVDVGRQVAKTGDMVRRLIGGDVKLHINIAPDLRPIVMDPGQLDQVVLNLAVNARDAMPSGGDLFIDVCNAEVSAGDAAAQNGATPGPHVRVTVRDTGTGMTDEVRAHIFEPFFTTKDVGRGTGLGLATVFGIVKRVHGAVTLDTEVGRGTAFMIWIPAST